MKKVGWKYVDSKAKGVKEKDVKHILDNEENIRKKVDTLDRSRYAGLIGQIKLLLEMLKDYWNGVYREVPWNTIAMITFGVIYFLNPFDIVPDIIALIGYVDDAAVVGLIVKAINDDLQKYANFKGIVL